MDELDLRRRLATALDETGPRPDRWGDVLRDGARRQRRIARRRRTVGAVVSAAVLGLGALGAARFAADREATTFADNDIEVVLLHGPNRPGPCYRITVGADRAEGCVDVPGASIWRVGSTDLVVAHGAIALGSGRRLEAGPAGLVAVRYTDIESDPPPDLRCLEPALADAVADAQGGRPFAVTGCTPSYALVLLEPRGGTWVYERRDPAWVLLGELPPDDSCGSLDKEGPASGGMDLEAICELLG